MDNTKLLTLYIASWAWHLIGMIFFTWMIFYLVYNKYLWMVAFSIVFAVCEIVAIRRQNDLRKIIKEESNGS